MSSALLKSKTISELPTTTGILGNKGLPALVWTAGIFWPVHVLGSDAKTCAVLHECSDSKETWKQKSKLVIVSGLLDQCDQKGGAARSWCRQWGFATTFSQCCRKHNASPNGMGRRS